MLYGILPINDTKTHIHADRRVIRTVTQTAALDNVRNIIDRLAVDERYILAITLRCRRGR